MRSTSAQAIVRSMRGNSHSHLIQAEDGHYYVTKFTSDTARRRRVINEWIGSQILSSLGVATPTVAFVDVTADFVSSNASVLAPVDQPQNALSGLQFGSEFPGDPATSIVYDYLPEKVISKVDNLDDFIGTMVVDLWCGKRTPRQALFVRTPKAGTTELRALMIDNGDLFGGATWNLGDKALPGKYPSSVPYRALTHYDDLSKWVEKIQALPESFFTELLSRLPAEWTTEDSEELRTLLAQLSARRAVLCQELCTVLSMESLSVSIWLESAAPRKAPASEHVKVEAYAQSVA